MNNTILLVDDDFAVRTVCRAVLERDGFTVHEADCADSAQSIWATHRQSIDLLVTDHDMPGMNGLQLVDKLRESNPELKVLLISGRAIASIPSSVTYLQKPFAPTQLTNLVRQLGASPLR